jgi:hypothetical protein
MEYNGDVPAAIDGATTIGDEKPPALGPYFPK